MSCIAALLVMVFADTGAAGLPPAAEAALRAAGEIAGANGDGSIGPGDRASILTSIAQVRLEAGDVPGAMAVARSSPTFRYSFGYLLKLGIAQARAGDPRGSAETFRQVSDGIETMIEGRPPGVDKAQAYSGLAVALAEAGDEKLAEQARSRFREVLLLVEGDRLRGSTAYHRNRLLTMMAVDLARSGRLRDATSLLATVDERSDLLAPRLISAARREMAEVQLDHGDLAGAIAILRAIVAPGSQARACLQICEERSTTLSKRNARALGRLAAKVAHGIVDRQELSMVTVKIALLQAELGEPAAAALSLERAVSFSDDPLTVVAYRGLFGRSAAPPDLKWKAAFLALCARVHHELGSRDRATSLLEDARKLGEQLGDSSRRDMARSDIADSQAAIGDWDGACRTLSEMGESNLRDELLGRLVVRYAKSGDLPKASWAIDRLGERPEGARIASVLVESVGQILASSDRLDQALRWSESRKTSIDRARSEIGIAAGLVMKARRSSRTTTTDLAP